MDELISHATSIHYMQMENVISHFKKSHVEGNQLGFQKNDYSKHEQKAEYSLLL